MRLRFKSFSKWFGGGEVERLVEEELLFHCDRLMEEYQEMGFTEEAARDAAERRFGNVERVQAECVEIRRRSRPAVKLLKLLLLLFFIGGLLLRITGINANFNHLGDLMMATALLCQLFLHVKGSRATGFHAIKKGSPLSILGRGAKPAVEAFDAAGRTPVERLMSDKTFKDS